MNILNSNSYFVLLIVFARSQNHFLPSTEMTTDQMDWRLTYLCYHFPNGKWVINLKIDSVNPQHTQKKSILTEILKSIARVCKWFASNSFWYVKHFSFCQISIECGLNGLWNSVCSKLNVSSAEILSGFFEIHNIVLKLTKLFVNSSHENEKGELILLLYYYSAFVFTQLPKNLLINDVRFFMIDGNVWVT